MASVSSLCAGHAHRLVVCFAEQGQWFAVLPTDVAVDQDVGVDEWVSLQGRYSAVRCEVHFTVRLLANEARFDRCGLTSMTNVTGNSDALLSWGRTDNTGRNLSVILCCSVYIEHSALVCENGISARVTLLLVQCSNKPPQDVNDFSEFPVDPEGRTFFVHLLAQGAFTFALCVPIGLDAL